MRPTKAEIERENKKALAILGTIGTLLVPGGAFVGLGRKAISSAFKKAGTIGNVKKADTVGNRLRQLKLLWVKKVVSLIDLQGDLVKPVCLIKDML